MSLAHARALTDARVEDFEPERDRRALRALAMWASRFSPCVGVDPFALTHDAEPDGLVMDISGCERLFASEQRHARLLLEGLNALDIRARIGIGPTIGVAWALARWGGRRHTGTKARRDKGGEAEEADGAASPRGAVPSCLRASSRAAIADVVRPLPVHALRLDPAIVAGLAELGVARVGHVLDLPRAELTRRFGDAPARRIDQLFGEAVELIDAVRPAPALRVSRRFDGPTTRLEAIELATWALLAELHEALLRREAGVRVLEIDLERLGRRAGEVVRETVMLGAPSRDVRHLRSLLAPRLERVQMGFGIEGVSLLARRTEPLPHRQAERWCRGPGARAEQDAGERLADVLANRLGRAAVTRRERGDAHLPERAFRHVEWSGAERTEPAPQHMLERPSLLLDPPEPAEAMALLPDRPPSWVRWRGMVREVRRGAGPERIGEAWWQERHGGTEARRHEVDGGGERASSPGSPAKPRTQALTPPRLSPAPRPQGESWSERSASPSLRASMPPCLSARDYFRVQTDDGLWLWIFRAGHRWFVHGVWI